MKNDLNNIFDNTEPNFPPIEVLTSDMAHTSNYIISVLEESKKIYHEINKGGTNYLDILELALELRKIKENIYNQFIRLKSQT